MMPLRFETDFDVHLFRCYKMCIYCRYQSINQFLPFLPLGFANFLVRVYTFSLLGHHTQAILYILIICMSQIFTSLPKGQLI